MAKIFRREVIEEAGRKVKSTVRTLHTPVDNLCLSAFTLIGNGDRLEAKISAVVLQVVQRDNKIAVRIRFPTGAQASFVERESDIIKPFFEIRHFRGDIPAKE